MPRLIHVNTYKNIYKAQLTVLLFFLPYSHFASIGARRLELKISRLEGPGTSVKREQTPHPIQES